VLVYAIGLTTRFRRITVREGMLLEGPAGWGEFCPFPEYDDAESASWLTAALEACTVGWPDPVRGRIPVNATVRVKIGDMTVAGTSVVAEMPNQ